MSNSPAAASPPREDERFAQCCHRTENGGCALVNLMLGWSDKMALEVCDRCWEAGGAMSQEGAQVRKEYVDDVISRVKRGSVKGYTRQVLTALTVFHMTPEEAAERSKELAEGCAKKVAWRKVRKTWEKAVSFARSMASGQGVDDETYRQRHLSCFGKTPEGEFVQMPCPKLVQNEKGAFCGACGCGEHELARLDGPKLRFKYLECPLGRPGFH